ncbi:hypothetical protein KSF_032350 [Reticulibacter mediterranei]|uniref:DUF2269 domain-containing protein n=1 Tax=Reticulibacter mediterranei TaxID=2778369 RepID=A0A8J3N0Q9_9CHLR|nr:hypothetical protein [Reticulibacter mediterranei]GHO93187.1 hypothetical protein KSF_032350 [Reticulibacter mediterranei]
MAKKLTITQRRWLISAHILFSIIWIGTSLCLLILALTALGTSDPSMLHIIYLLAEVLDKTLIWGSSIGALATGFLLSILTHWGLLRFYWIIVKEVLSIFSFALGYAGLHTWLTHLGTMTAVQSSDTIQAAYPLTLHIYIAGCTLELAALVIMVIISVFRPWGQFKSPKKPMRMAIPVS